jgi:kumamolisin
MKHVYSTVTVTPLALMLFLAGCDSGGSGDSSGSSSANGGTNLGCAPAQITEKSNGEVMRAAASAGALTKLTSHIPSVVKGFSDQGKVADEQTLPVTIALELNNQTELFQKLNSMYRPGSSDFHQFLSPQEFRDRYAPTADQVAQVASFLNAHGIQALSLHENGFMFHGVAKVKAVSSAFHTEIHQYKDAQNHAYFAPAYELQIPAGLPIQAIHGLQNVSQWHAHAKPMSADAAISPKAGSGPDGGLAPADIKTAYDVPNLTGSGQTLALLELDGYSSSDIKGYENEFALRKVPLQNVYIDGASGTAGSGAPEVTLDIELMAAIAPGATKILVYEAPNSDQAILDAYARIASDDLANQVSTSWGIYEAANTNSFLKTENSIFMQMAAQGQSMYAASGDSGADDNGSSLSVDDPASQPYVVGVGGTHLNVSGNGSYSSETTWNNGSPSDGAGGGGVSAVWNQPSWQSGVANHSNSASGNMRNVPDVSLNADPYAGYSIYLYGEWTIYGGTSCAAPLWAAFTALVNQQRQTNGLAAMGFPSPLFYSIGKSNAYSTSFHDINDGSTNLYYPAVSGFDNATGWGSFYGQGLFNELIEDNPIYVPSGGSC